MRTLILAGSFREASTYARARDLRFYRFASSAAAVETFSAQRVVELPGFARRADRHALIAVANRVTRRGGEWVKDEYVPEPEPVDDSPLGILGRMTREDWLLAGATPAQAAQLTPQLTVEQREAVDRVNAEKAEPKPAAKPKRTRKTPPPPRRTSSGNARVPVAAEKTSIPNTDPFQD